MTNKDVIANRLEPHWNDQGLIPAVTQDAVSGEVLMLAWMNREALELTIKTGEVHYWSRSRQKIWHKGETSGHTQILKDIRDDCDADVMLLTIDQTGSVACHTWKVTADCQRRPRRQRGGGWSLRVCVRVCVCMCADLQCMQTNLRRDPKRG